MIKSHTIENKFLRVKTLNMGATLYEVYHKKKKINLILNLDKISSYQNNQNYLGSTCGRFANRIKNAQFKIKNTTYKLSKNEGKNILHGSGLKIITATDLEEAATKAVKEAELV